MDKIKYLLANLKSLLCDGRTFGQKKRYPKRNHPLLYHYLYEIED